MEYYNHINDDNMINILKSGCHGICTVCGYLLTAVLAIFVYGTAQAQPTNYDESKVPDYVLPDALVMSDGSKVVSREQWMEQRRPELMEMFRHEVYGYEPGRPKGLHFETVSEDSSTMEGRATRKEVRIWFDRQESHYMTLLMYVPNGSPCPVPAFLGINFKGNHTITDDPYVSLPEPEQVEWYGDGYEFYDRGYQKSRWPVEYLVEHGYACATFCMSDIDPDYYDGFRNGVHGIFDEGQRDSTSWASISAWAWGLSRAMDYLETDPDIDASKVVVHGHSRLAKTALWAGATDQRFAIVVANCPGCTGAAISRRKYGETLKAVQTTFPHWFCTNYRKYMGKEETLPFDQHELLAMIAPRPLYIESCSLDRWGDPKGEFLGLVNAAPVYELFGYEGIHGEELPPENEPVVTDRLGYHLRTGSHDIKLYDFEQYVKFADKFFRPVQPGLDARDSAAVEYIRELYPGGTVELTGIVPMYVYSPIGEYEKMLPICREALARMQDLQVQLKYAGAERRKAIIREAASVRMSAHSSRDNMTWNTTMTPTQTWKKKYRDYPESDYRQALEVRFRHNGYPRIEYLFYDRTDKDRVHHSRKDLLEMYDEYVRLQDDIDRIFRRISGD